MKKKTFNILGTLFLIVAIASSVYFFLEYKQAKNTTLTNPGSPPVQQEEKRVHLEADSLDNPTGPVIQSEFNYEEELKKYDKTNATYQAELSSKEGKESFNQTAMFASGGILAILALLCFGFAALIKPEKAEDTN